MSPTSQIAVVGAGITGVTAALELMERGHDVVLFDRIAPGSGTSSAANGAITPYSDDTIPAEIVKLAEESLSLYPGHIARLHELSGKRVHYDAGGVLQLLLEGDDPEAVESEFARLAGAGYPVDWLSHDDASAVEPGRLRSRLRGL